MEKEEQMAYAAGCMEGDGSFFIMRRQSPKCTRYVAGANIGKSSKELIAFFIGLFGGNVSYRGDHCRWQVSSDIRTRPFLESIVPYLQMKKDRAIYLLNWLKEGMKDKEKSYDEMKDLNEKVDRFSVDCGLNVINEPWKWAYIAGLMDTDGSFMISKRSQGTKSPVYAAKVSYAEIDRRPVHFLQNISSMGTIAIKENGNCPQKRFVWEMVIKDQICDFIRNLIPYLNVKKKNAEVVLKFCENVKPMTKGHRFGVPKEELEFRETCFQELKPLQRR